MNRTKYQKQYQKKHYKKLRQYKTKWAMAQRDRKRLLTIKEKIKPINNILEQILDKKSGRNKKGRE